VSYCDHAAVDQVRIDKWLWAARMFKTRSAATGAVVGGRVHVNGERVKPSKVIRTGDTIEVTGRAVRRTLVVTGLADRRRPASDALTLYEETPESLLARERHAAERRLSRPLGADLGARPTKQARRRLDALRRGQRAHTLSTAPPRRSQPRSCRKVSAALERRAGLRALAVAICVLALSTAFAAQVDADATAKPELTRALQAGGLVLVLRHAATDFSKPDEDPVDLTDCATQRNLSQQGRADARAIGRGVRRLDLRVSAVLTSAFCRTRETARLAFGPATVTPALLNTITAAHDARWRAQIRAARRLLGTKPPPRTIRVLVTHGVVVSDATSLTLEEGETLVLRPLGSSRYRLLGRILAHEWRALSVA
jgi:ribosome-associated heat shock protein Hsp15